MIETSEGEAPVFENLQVFRMADAMARHAGVRQGVIAENMANADTPEYRARDIRPFSETVNESDATFGQRATRAGHLNGAAGPNTYEASVDRGAWASPNGNSVLLEEQVFKSVEVQKQHSQALAIYKSALGLMRTSIGRR